MNKYLILMFIFFVIIYTYIIITPNTNNMKSCESKPQSIYSKTEEYKNPTSIY